MLTRLVDRFDTDKRSFAGLGSPGDHALPLLIVLVLVLVLVVVLVLDLFAVGSLVSFVPVSFLSANAC